MRVLAACYISAVALCASNAVACPDAATQGSVLAALQKPVVGELADGFGMRLHPILLYERMHTGVDYAAAVGTPVYAAAAGEIVFAARDGAYGNRVVIAHGDRTETAYAHLHRINVKRGDCVAQGAMIGAVGSTGLTVGSQLHFEVLRNGRFIDPSTALAAPR